ncbi:MAG: hypothetical protein LBJ87_00430, partial [bacterium]|nr:hypothetical protein [bacterium]
VHGEETDPVLPFRLCPEVLQRRLQVERHDVGGVRRLHSLEIRNANRLDQAVDSPPNACLLCRQVTPPRVAGNAVTGMTDPERSV